MALTNKQYTACLLHFAVLDGAAAVSAPLAVERPLPHLALLGIGALAVTAVGATITHGLIEQPGVRLGRRLGRHIASRRNLSLAAARAAVLADRPA